jgi:hypothetical protein
VQLWCLRLACALLGPNASPMLHKRLSVTALLPILLARLKTYKVTSPSIPQIQCCVGTWRIARR